MAKTIPPAIRKKYEDKVFALMSEFDAYGYNRDVYKNAFANMSDVEFIAMAKKIRDISDVNFSIEVDSFDEKEENVLTVKDAIRIAEKFKIATTEYVFMPFRNPGGEPTCTMTKVPILYLQLRRFFQQMLAHKNAITNSNSKNNPLTGQVVAQDKAASTTDVQTYALAVTNQNNAIKEFLGPRSDDQVSKQEMLSLIEKNGSVRLDDLNIKTHNKQSINTTEVFMKAACLDVRFSGND